MIFWFLIFSFEKTHPISQVFKDNLIHCDLHPGNILVEKAAVSRKAGLFNTFRRVITPDYVADDTRLIILDCGLVASLNDRCRQNLRNVFHSVLMGNVSFFFFFARYNVSFVWQRYCFFFLFFIFSLLLPCVCLFVRSVKMEKKMPIREKTTVHLM